MKKSAVKKAPVKVETKPALKLAAKPALKVVKAKR